MHCRWDWGQNWSRAWYLCFRHSSLAWLQVGWDKNFFLCILTFHLLHSHPTIKLCALFCRGCVYCITALSHIARSVLFWVLMVLSYIFARIWSNSKKTSFHLKKNPQFSLRDAHCLNYQSCVYFVVGEQFKNKQCVAVYHSLPFFKKDKTASTSLRKNSQLFTANNYLEIAGYHMRIVGFFF